MMKEQRPRLKTSNLIITVINAITMVISLPIIGIGIWLTTQTASECAKFLQVPIIIIGVFILILSALGYFGSLKRITILLWIYLVTMAALIILLAAFTLFTFLVTMRGHGKTVPGQAFKEYTLDEFHPWLAKQVSVPGRWFSIRSCMLDPKEFCAAKFDREYKTRASYFNAQLSPLESGCCKPPHECGYKFVNSSYWEVVTPPGSTNTDCSAYRNYPKYCVDCNSCKGGFLSFLKHEWRIAFIVQLSTLIALFLIYCTGCFARYHSGRDDYFIRLSREYETERV